MTKVTKGNRKIQKIFTRVQIFSTLVNIKKEVEDDEQNIVIHL